MSKGIYQTSSPPVGELPFEYVERKGLGHPDSICDSVMEAAQRALSEQYQQICGRILHHNLDKALLVAGQSEPRVGGGRITGPMKMVVGDRATSLFGDVRIPVCEIVEHSVREWFEQNLRFVDSKKHILFQNEIQPGSAELSHIFQQSVPVANDTSAAFGFAPLSETERLVLAAEHYINSTRFKENFPAAGEDVKVMAVRDGRRLRMTIAIAFVDRFVSTEADYFEQKEAIRQDVTNHVDQLLERVESVDIGVNKLDDPGRRPAGMYLTVLGTSAESADGGEVGRGNAVNGLISLNRPASNEAAAGKNTTCHVGSIYSHLAHRIARDIIDSCPPVREANVWLCSQIGRPVLEPWSISVSLSLEAGVELADVREKIENVLARHVGHKL